MRKSLFGKYNTLIDELGHLSISLIIIVVLNIWFELSNLQNLTLLLSSLLIDIDHLFNPVIAKTFAVKATVVPSKDQDGVTIKILHGIDLFLIISFIIFIYSGNTGFAVGLFLVLTFHELWDFLVYDHTHKELFLLTRLRARFKPGQRNYLVGRIFDVETLNR